MEMYPFSICMKKENVRQFQGLSNITDEQVYISLLWQLIFKILIFIIWKYGDEFIIHIWREQENITAEKRILHKENIIGILEKFPFAKISIYKDYEIFMKSELLYSSLSDLVAYFTTRIESRNDNGMPQSKILRDNYEIIKLLSDVFSEYEYIDVKNLSNYIKEVSIREHYRA